MKDRFCFEAPSSEPPQPMTPEYWSQLKSWVIDTHKRCTFHRKRFERIGADPSSLTLDNWGRLPLLGGHEIHSELALLPDEYAVALKESDLRAFEPRDRVAKKFSSSGSTGVPKVSFYTHDDWLNAQANCLRMLSD